MTPQETNSQATSEEVQLLREGHDWLRRVVSLVTRTSKLKVWVPVACSSVLSVYYLWTLHAKPTITNEHPQAAIEAPPPAHTSPTPQTASSQSPLPPTMSAEPDEDSTEIRRKAQQAHSAQQFAEEAKLWQRFIDSSGLPQEACPQIGKAYERAGDMDSAIEAYEHCVSADPENVDILTAFAHALQTKRDFNRAASIYKQCVAKDPRNLDAQTGLALIELKQGQIPEAQQAAKSVLRVAPDNTDALLIAGIAAWRQDQLGDAEKIFLKGETLDDGRADFHAFLGRIAEAQRRPQEALRQYQRALVLDPSDSEIAERRDRLEAGR